jgi:hypothetical protein
VPGDASPTTSGSTISLAGIIDWGSNISFLGSWRVIDRSESGSIRFGVCHQQGIRFEPRPVLPDVPVVGPLFRRVLQSIAAIGQVPALSLRSAQFTASAGAACRRGLRPPDPIEKAKFPMQRSVGLAWAEAPDQAGVDQVIAHVGELEQLDRGRREWILGNLGPRIDDPIG